MMLTLATFAIVALSSSFESEAFHMFPLRFDYNQDKTSDHAVKTLTYSSPFTGKTYKLDYQSDFGSWQPPPGPSPFPISKTWNFDSNWLFNKGTTKSVSQPMAFPIHSFMPKIFRWDSNWNFNKGTGSNMPSKVFNWDFNWNINKGTEQTQVTSTTEKTTTASTVSNSNTVFHKKVDIKVSYGPSTNPEELPKVSNDTDETENGKEEKTRDNESGKNASSDDDTDIDPIDSE
ncbi:hypothetical protein PVAND_006853 [Polypedilum vanderplanki]|uniref:Secreted protein n=1 Tax=Polypedilum vanderplanki TaxID=319348 RepID=A0A9J6C593_POLVA|nr:hypothetical protein PVAND_006853 [Polypedilum vanderplanki]